MVFVGTPYGQNPQILVTDGIGGSLPENVSALTLLQMVYRGALKVSPLQMRAAIESLPYENPQLSAVALRSMTGNDFARALDRCIERSSKAKLIELKATNG